MIGIIGHFPLNPKIPSVEETSSSVHQEVPVQSGQARGIWEGQTRHNRNAEMPTLGGNQRARKR